jgi:hypothetical protein
MKKEERDDKKGCFELRELNRIDGVLKRSLQNFKCVSTANMRVLSPQKTTAKENENIEC